MGSARIPLRDMVSIFVCIRLISLWDVESLSTDSITSLSCKDVTPEPGRAPELVDGRELERKFPYADAPEFMGERSSRDECVRLIIELSPSKLLLSIFMAGAVPGRPRLLYILTSCCYPTTSINTYRSTF